MLRQLFFRNLLLFLSALLSVFLFFSNDLQFDNVPVKQTLLHQYKSNSFDAAFAEDFNEKVSIQKDQFTADFLGAGEFGLLVTLLVLFVIFSAQKKHGLYLLFRRYFGVSPPSLS